METSKLKRFAADARINLMAGVRRRLQVLGFDDEGRAERAPELIQGGTLWGGEEFPESFHTQWMALAERLRSRGVREVVEEAAYTWFNRMMAIRILAKNGLCDKVLSIDDTTGLPEILAEARVGRFPQMDIQQQNCLTRLMDDDTRTTDQFALLLTAWCHANPIINSCFGAIDDYVALLLPGNILDADGFLALLNDTEFISDDDFHSAELIGWLYQFYISDRKDEVFAKKGKVEADEIPAATQIFTPNWIVKYMVENTIIPQVDAADDVVAECQYLVKRDADSSHTIDLEEIKVADFACGSGHILNECFDLLYKLYMAEAFSRREAIESIFTNNLVGIDIDLRAKQLATFALMLKACQRDASFADAHCLPRVLTVPAFDKAIFNVNDEESIRGYLHHFFMGAETRDCADQLTEAIILTKDADSLGSIIKFDISSSTRRQLVEAMQYWREQTYVAPAIEAAFPLMDFILALTDSYDAIVMNPPYMPTGKTDGLKEYATRNYPDSKIDLFSVFMDVCIDRLKDGGKYGMINMQSWMFLSSFESLRKRIIDTQQIDSLLHLGPRTFDELSGEVVQNAAFVISKSAPSAPGIYYRLIDGKNCNAKREMFLANDNRYVIADQKQFEQIPGSPIAYWVSEKMLSTLFINKNALDDEFLLREGIHTADNDRFTRHWHEVDQNLFSVDADSYNFIDNNNKRWIPYNKGGGNRKWYGCNYTVIGFDSIYRDNMSKLKGHVRPSESLYFKEGGTWSSISSKGFAIRYYPKGYLFDAGGQVSVSRGRVSIISCLAYMNSKVFDFISKIVMPTINNKCGIIKTLPNLIQTSRIIEDIVRSNISISKEDWDAHETSWDFQENPLITLSKKGIGRFDVEFAGSKSIQYYLEHVVSEYESVWETKFRQLHANEEELNRQFIEIYGLQDELTPDVPLDEVTILQNGEISILKNGSNTASNKYEGVSNIESNKYEEISNNDADAQPTTSSLLLNTYSIRWNRDVIMKQLISYIVGCYMGRYRLDRPGLAIAHPEATEEELAPYTFSITHNETFTPDSDGIIPVLPSDAPFYDNLVKYVKEFVGKVWEEEDKNENLNFMEQCLGKSLDDYLSRDFWKDHKKMYQNRPIYWEFASKKGAFRALVYAHRMDRFTVEVMRSKYLLPYIGHIERKIAALEARQDELSTPERRELDNLRKKILPELAEYHKRVEQVAAHFAGQPTVFDLDDGIVRNHALFGDIVTKLK